MSVFVLRLFNIMVYNMKYIFADMHVLVCPPIVVVASGCLYLVAYASPHTYMYMRTSVLSVINFQVASMPSSK